MLVPSRTDRQCRKRWTQVLHPVAASKTAGRWKPEEEAKLIKAVKKYGKGWVAIAAMIPGRSGEQCRTRWTQALDPVAASKTAGQWKPEEDAKLTKAVKKYGKGWVAIAAMIPGRSGEQCRSRWVRSLDPNNGN
jgi:hypothetical protein